MSSGRMLHDILIPAGPVEAAYAWQASRTSMAFMVMSSRSFRRPDLTVSILVGMSKVLTLMSGLLSLLSLAVVDVAAAEAVAVEEPTSVLMSSKSMLSSPSSA